MTEPTPMSLEQGQQLVRLLRAFFFNREDKVAAKMPWGKPHPVIGMDNLPGLLLAHVMGEASPHKGAARYENRQGALKVQTGLFRIGSYTPDDEGNTRWLCLDFDGAGHSDPLEDPEAAVRLTHAAFAAQGIPAYIERSGGGKGWHLWVFLSEPTPAKLVRQLAQRLIPDNLPLANGRGVAMPRSNRGVEVFPKQDKPTTPKRLGNLVYLPWYHGAPAGANQFYREENGTLVLVVPDTFETVSPADAERILGELTQRTTTAPSPSPADPSPRTHVDETALEEFLRRATKEDDEQPAPSRDLQEWKAKALPLLDLDLVYGRWITGERSGEGWCQCQDPESPSGADSKSGNVADGSGQALRGTYHSWRTNETLSVFDFMVRHGLAGSFLDAARQVAEWTGVPLPERPARSTGAPPPQPGYPIIVINNRQTRDIRYDAEQVLLAANAVDPFLFVRAARPVRILMANNEPHISEVDAVVMYDLLAKHANWVYRTDDGDGNVSPPRDIPRMLVATPSPSLPWLDGLVTAPVFDASGQIISRPGFHRPSGVWYHQPDGFLVPPVPDSPTQVDIDAARALLLDELLVDFPFVSDSDRAHAVAALILPFVRRLVLGPTPVHLYEAPTPGSGKTLAAEIVCLIATGEAAEPTTMPQDDEEVRKKITSLLLAARPVVLLDNVRGGIDSVSLAAVLTAEKWTDRLLGGNELAGLPNKAVWLISANNPTLTLEIARRCIRIRVEPAGDRPWERKNFRHWPLKHWVLDNRAALVHAILTLVQAWLSRGRPLGKRTLGSFEHWASIIGGILEVAGIPAFLENTAELYEAADVEGQEWREFTAAWWKEHGATPVSPTVLLQLASSNELLAHVLSGKTERAQAIRLGKGLMSNRNRIFGEYRIQVARQACNQRLWQLVRVDSQQTTTTDDEPDGPWMLLPFQRDIHSDIHARKPAPQAANMDVMDVMDVNPTLAHASASGPGTTGETRDAPSRTRVWGTREHIHDIHDIHEPQENGGSQPMDVGMDVGSKKPPTSIAAPPEDELDLANLPDDEVDP